MSEPEVATATPASPAATPPAPAPTPAPLTPEERRDVAKAAEITLKALMDDPGHAAKFLAGDAAAKAEVGKLIRAKLEGDRVDAALAGALSPSGLLQPNIGGISPQNLNAAVAGFREIGVSTEALREMLTGKPVDQATYDAVMEFRSQLLGSREWVQKWMSGDRECRKQAVLFAIVKNNGIKKEAA